MIEFCALKTKTLKLDNDNKVKKAEGTKKCVVKRHITFDDYVNTLFNNNKLLKSQFSFKSDHHKIYTKKINKMALNYFDDKRIQCSDKITTYPYGYFNNNSSINSERKDNTDKCIEIDNSGIIPQNYNTKDPLKNTNATLDINEIIDANDSYADSAKSACIDNIKSANYLDSIKSTCNDTIKNKFTYVESAKSACKDKIKSAIVNINYIDSTKSTCTDRARSANIKITKQKSNITRIYCKNINTKSAHSKINYELSALLKIKMVSNTNIIIKKKLNPQVININYELSMPNKLKKVTNASKNVIAFLNKHITQIIKGNKVHTHNEINNTVIHDNIKKAHAKSAIPINKVDIENNTAGNTCKKTHKTLFKKCLSK